MHPLAEQCSATSKASGKRCQRRVIGGGPCIMHGGKARQVKARREQRILVWQAEQRTLPPIVEPELEPTADEILIGLLRDVRRTFEHVKAGLVGNSDPSALATWLSVMGEWADRLDRVSKSAIVLNVEARITERETHVTGDQVRVLTGVLDRVLGDHRVSIQGDARLVVADAMRAEGLIPPGPEPVPEPKWDDDDVDDDVLLALEV
jgi:hypothetical protein